MKRPHTKTSVIENIQQAVEVGTTLSRSWFRGHSEIQGELTPCIFRKQYQVQHAWRGGFEHSVTESFKIQAPALSEVMPPPDDNIAWSFLMQHHGTPTRLLDWTESALIALYFTVNSSPKKDGELWSMYPDVLNEHTGFFGIALARHKLIQFLASEHGHSNPEKLAKQLKIEEIPKSPIALQPPQHFGRMVAQMSTFTIHPTPSAGNTIPELLRHPEHLIRYIVPADAKRQLMYDLASLGITQKTLFPDLDGLSQSIVHAHTVIAYSPPSPPYFGPPRKKKKRKRSTTK